jgi:hypothetical protein
MDWLSTVRGRAGVAFDRWLLYGTAGLAFAKVSLDSSVTVGNPPMGALTGSEDRTKMGMDCWRRGRCFYHASPMAYGRGSITTWATSPSDRHTRNRT